jgi:glutamate-ammonia-ligase adenylyltransferase
MDTPFIDQITRHPLPFDIDVGEETAAEFADFDVGFQALITGVAGCSPYLRELIGLENTWLRQVVSQPTDETMRSILADLPTHSDTGVATSLRIAKRRAALFIALADIGGVWGLKDVTGHLSTFADHAIQAALEAALAPELARGKLPGATMDDLTTGAGMSVLAMGKLGAGELNYSSDIDLICLFDETRFDPSDVMEARSVFIKVTRRMTKLLSDITADGFVFRTDLRLRPDASVTPVCMAMDAAERYYESLGRTWERAAFIKARTCAGDMNAGSGFLKRMIPFVWRRHLDFAAIEDAHQMRQRIHDHKGLHGAALEGRDLKLAPGGIREIEFFTQTRQLIAGGRDPSLRSQQTVGGLAALAAKNWITVQAAAELTDAYTAHRELEHRLQMVANAHTHQLPKSESGFDRIARFEGYADTTEWTAQVAARITHVTEVVEAFYAHGDPKPEAEPDTERTKAWARYPALRSDRAVSIFERLKPGILARLNAATRPDEAFAAFDGFLGGLPAGVQLFSMFEANPQLLDLIIDIATTAPQLAQHLSQNSGVLDAVIGGAFFGPWPGVDGLTDSLLQNLNTVDAYEDKLDVVRRWAKEWHFRIGVHHLRRLTDAEDAGAQYAQLAETVVAQLYPVVVDQFARRHGPPPGRGAMVLAMGSLGAGWMTAHSDLDLIVIFDGAEAQQSEGQKPLSVRPYYARLTQALVTALSVATAEGKLYDVDMRLRPSGRQGPVATSLTSFDNYQRTEAWTWEHLALTRARALAGPQKLMDDVDHVRAEVLAMPRDPAKVVSDVTDMRRRLNEAQKSSQGQDPKTGFGKLQDIDLLAQTATLISGAMDRGTSDQLKHCSVLGVSEEPLREAFTLMRTVQSLMRLTGREQKTVAGEGAARLILSVTGDPDWDALDTRLANFATQTDQLITSALANP